MKTLDELEAERDAAWATYDASNKAYREKRNGENPMKTPHVHAALIHAWADGAEVEVLDHSGKNWYITTAPKWAERLKYRIKAEEKPDVVRTAEIHKDGLMWNHSYRENIKLTFDGETGKLKAAEVIK